MTKTREKIIAAVKALEGAEASYCATWSSWKCSGCGQVKEMDGHAAPPKCLCGKPGRRWRRTGMGTIKACNFTLTVK